MNANYQSTEAFSLLLYNVHIFNSLFSRICLLKRVCFGGITNIRIVKGAAVSRKEEPPPPSPASRPRSRPGEHVPPVAFVLRPDGEQLRSPRSPGQRQKPSLHHALASSNYPWKPGTAVTTPWTTGQVMHAWRGGPPCPKAQAPSADRQRRRLLPFSQGPNSWPAPRSSGLKSGRPCPPCLWCSREDASGHLRLACLVLHPAHLAGPGVPPSQGATDPAPNRHERALRKSVVSFSSPSHACLWAFHSPSIRPPLLKGPVRADRG